MNAYDIVSEGLHAAHNGEFREAMRPELQRRLLEFSETDWQTLKTAWPRRDPEWQFNLCDTLSPGRHGKVAAEMLLDLLLHGPEALILVAAEKLMASDVLDEVARRQIADRIQHAPPVGQFESAMRQQLLVQIIRPELRPSIAEASEFSIRNRDTLAESSLAACYYCQTVFPSTDISEFADGGTTALCPRCGIDAVLPSSAGYSFSEATLRALHEFWFG